MSFIQNLNTRFSRTSTIRTQIFSEAIKFSMIRMIQNTDLPLNFEIQKFHIWRLSAPAYGIYYDPLKKNYII